MTSIKEIMGIFESQIEKILDESNKKKEEIHEMNLLLDEKFLDKEDPKQVALAREFANQPVTIKTGIHLYIESEKLADEVHDKIHDLVSEKAYPINETDWFCSAGTNRWYFGFIY